MHAVFIGFDNLLVTGVTILFGIGRWIMNQSGIMSLLKASRFGTTVTINATDQGMYWINISIGFTITS